MSTQTAAPPLPSIRTPWESILTLAQVAIRQDHRYEILTVDGNPIQGCAACRKLDQTWTLPCKYWMARVVVESMVLEECHLGEPLHDPHHTPYYVCSGQQLKVFHRLLNLLRLPLDAIPRRIDPGCGDVGCKVARQGGQTATEWSPMVTMLTEWSRGGLLRQRCWKCRHEPRHGAHGCLMVEADEVCDCVENTLPEESTNGFGEST